MGDGVLSAMVLVGDMGNGPNSMAIFWTMWGISKVGDE